MIDKLTEEDLLAIEARCNATQIGPWIAFIEGRNHFGGSSFILTGQDSERGEDIEMIGATDADFDFIANAKQDIPRLLCEIRRLWSEGQGNR